MLLWEWFEIAALKILKISTKIIYVIEFPFNKIVRVYSTVYYRLKNPLQILFWSCRLFKGVLKILENVQEKLCFGVPLSKLQVFRLQPLALPSIFVKFWNIPEITCAVEFIFTEAGAIRFSIRDLSTQF